MRSSSAYAKKNMCNNDGTCRLTEIDWRISIVSDLNEESNMESASSITKYDKSEKNKRSKKKKGVETTH